MAEPTTVEAVKIKPPHGKSLKFDGTNVERFLHQYQVAARLDKASGQDMAEQLFFFASMLSYWGEVDSAKFTARDIRTLTEGWVARGGVSSVEDYQAFRKHWEPIQAYLLAKDHIDSVEEIRNDYYQSFSLVVQDRIREQLLKDNTMITTADNRFKLPKFDVL
ncbi:hypothetical protein PTTG_08393, partial [Puccinia triticina 1-1 BBBD Race 1]